MVKTTTTTTTTTIVHNKTKTYWYVNWITEVIDIYWGRNLQMVQTFLFVRLKG